MTALVLYVHEPIVAWVSFEVAVPVNELLR